MAAQQPSESSHKNFLKREAARKAKARRIELAGKSGEGSSRGGPRPSRGAGSSSRGGHGPSRGATTGYRGGNKPSRGTSGHGEGSRGGNMSSRGQHQVQARGGNMSSRDAQAFWSLRKVPDGERVNGGEFNRLIDHMRRQDELLQSQETMLVNMKKVVQGMEAQVNHLELEKDASRNLIASLEARVKGLERGDEVFVTPAPSLPNLSEPGVGGNVEEDLRKLLDSEGEAEEEENLLSMEVDPSGDKEVATEASA